MAILGGIAAVVVFIVVCGGGMGIYRVFFAGKWESCSGKWVLSYVAGTLFFAACAACMTFGAIAQ